MEIARKIYYEKATGNVLVDTGERSGSVVETTIEQDFASYLALQGLVPETVGVAQFEYGQFSEDFIQCSGYRINPTTLAIEFVYPDPGTPTPEPVFQKPLTVEVDDLRSRISDVEMFVADMIGGV